MKRALALTLVLALVAAIPAAAQGKKKDKDRRGFVWDDRPTFVFGKDVDVELKGRALMEWRWFDPDQGENLFHLRSARLGLKGKLTRHVSWEIERQVTKNAEDRQVEFGDWKDVNAEWRTFDAIRVKGGRFKVPFGLEQTNGISELDFVYQSLGSAEIAPGRDRGGMVFGDLGHVNYEVGVFDDDGDNAKSNAPQFVLAGQHPKNLGPGFAARVVGDVFRPFTSGRLRSANVGIAYTSAELPEGLFSLRGESVFGYNLTNRAYVKGRRQRLGTQFEWTPGSKSLKAEWMQSREQRKQQSNRNQDLSDLVGTAWYVSGSWIITGEKKDKNIKVKHQVYRGGPGAIELAARIERLTFESASKEGPAFTNPRADHVQPNGDTVFTAGVNWTTSRWTRVIFNAIHESIVDATRAPKKGETSFWSGVVRLNVVF